MPEYALQASHVLLPLDRIRRWTTHEIRSLSSPADVESALSDMRKELPMFCWRANQLVDGFPDVPSLVLPNEEEQSQISQGQVNKLEDLEQTAVLRGLVEAARQDRADRVVRAVLRDYLTEEAQLEKAVAQALIETIERRVWSRQQLRRDSHTGRRMRADIYSAVGLRYTSKIRIVVLTGDGVEEPPQLERMSPYWTHKTKDGRRCPCPEDRECCGQAHVYHPARNRVTIGEVALVELMQRGPYSIIV